MAYKLRGTKETQELETGNTAQQSTSTMAVNNIGTIGSMREFTLKEDFQLWFEQFEEYVAANLIPEGRSVALFLTLMGEEGYKLVRNLCFPQKPRDKSLNELVTLIKGNLNPKPNTIAERYKFKKRTQRSNESITMFLAELKQLSLYCDFGDTLNNNFRDQFVLGVNNERFQRRLLAERLLSFEKAIEMALAWEAAEKDVQNMCDATRNEARPAMNFIGATRKQTASREGRHASVRGKKQHGNRGRSSRMRCGKDNHFSDGCHFKDYTCIFCGKVGHLAKICQEKNKTVTGSNKKSYHHKYVNKKESAQNFLVENIAS